MITGVDADDLVPFSNVTVISATGTSMLCRIGHKKVWLPRRHISGTLFCVGDRGALLIRRWIAHDRRLLPKPGATAVSALGPSSSRRRLAARLHLARRDRIGIIPDGLNRHLGA